MKKLFFLFILLLSVGVSAKEVVCSDERPMKVSRLCGYQGRLYYVLSGNCLLDACVSCDTPTVYMTTAEECAKCPNRLLREEVNGKGLCGLKECPDDLPLSDLGICSSCDIQSATKSSPEECARCPNREMRTYKNNSGEERSVCVLKTCPDNAPVRSKFMDCVPCEGASDNFETFTKEECETCDYLARWEDGVCRGICPSILTNRDFSEKCNMCFSDKNAAAANDCRLCVRRDGSGYCQMKK